MSQNTPIQGHERDASARLVLLVLLGVSLVGTGALLWSRHGDAIALGNPILAALAWCF